MNPLFVPDVEDIARGLERVSAGLSGKTMVLTGAAGFLGRWMVRTVQYLNEFILDKPLHVFAVDAVASDTSEFEGKNFDFCHHNLSSELKFGYGGPADFVVHAAGIASPYWYRRKPLETIDVAVHGSREMLELARRTGARYLFFSTSEVYQTPPKEMIPTPESYIGAVPTLGPRSCYDVSKLMGETLAHTYGEAFGVDVGIIRIFNSFGPGMAQADHRIIPRLGSAVKAGRPLKAYIPAAAVHPRRTYCPVANTITGAFLALLRGGRGEVYNIGASDPEMSVLDLCTVVTDLGHKIDVELMDPPSVYETEPMRRCPDITKAHDRLGYRPAVSLETGLERFLSWSQEAYSAEM